MKNSATYAKMDGQGMTKALGEKKSYTRDFGATRMNIEELERGIKRALKRKQRMPEKAEMYNAQITAYRDRIRWYSEK